MDIQTIINKKLNSFYIPSLTTTITTGDDPAAQANWFEGTRLPR